MKNMLQIELKRAFVNRGFIIALAAGTLICLWHYFEIVFPCIFDKSLFVSGDDCYTFFPPTSYNYWLGGNYVPIQSYLYFLILPLIAALPYGNSYICDKKSGFIKNIYTRTQKNNYLISKYISVFLTGAASAALPLLINFFLTALTLPSITPDSASYNSIVFSYSKWSDIFYTNPLLFEFLYILIAFVFSGLIATVSLSVSFLVNNRLIVVFVPMILYVFLSSVADITGLKDLDLMRIINPTQGYGNTVTVILYVIVLFILTFFSFFTCEVKSDAL